MIFRGPDWLVDDYVTMESVHGLFGSGHLLVMIDCVFNTKHGAVQSGTCTARARRISGAMTELKTGLLVIPAQAGIQTAALDSRLRGNDGIRESSIDDALWVAAVSAAIIGNDDEKCDEVVQ